MDVPNCHGSWIVAGCLNDPDTIRLGIVAPAGACHVYMTFRTKNVYTAPRQPQAVASAVMMLK